MLGFPTQIKFTIAPLGFMFLFILLQYFDLYSVLNLDQTLVDSGETWRVFTGQFVHSNWSHTYLNMAGLLLVWALHGEYYSPKSLVFKSIVGALFVGLAVFFLSSYGSYSGFSGVLHFLLGYGALKDIDNGDKTGWLLLIGLISKVAYENLWGASLATMAMIEAHVAVDAHAFGLLGGLLYFAITKSPWKLLYKGS